jgi:hypothetical protein
MMIRRQKSTTTTASPTTSIAKLDLPPSSPVQQERQDTDGLHDNIATRAYALYEQRGYRLGRDLQDWLDAEREILGRNPPV